jgi:hypothetical protein
MLSRVHFSNLLPNRTSMQTSRAQIDYFIIAVQGRAWKFPAHFDLSPPDQRKCRNRAAAPHLLFRHGGRRFTRFFRVGGLDRPHFLLACLEFNRCRYRGRNRIRLCHHSDYNAAQCSHRYRALLREHYAHFAFSAKGHCPPAGCIHNRSSLHHREPRKTGPAWFAHCQKNNRSA